MPIATPFTRDGFEPSPGIVTAHRVALIAILALSFALRLAHAGQPLIDAFSWREASTAMMADNFATNGWNIFYPEVSWTGPGPSYQGREFQLLSYIAALANLAFGWHDWTGRLIASFFGLLTTFAIHGLTRRVWDVGHAHAAALAYALMPAAIMIDSSFLPDPAMLALVTTGAWLMVAYADTDDHDLLMASAFLLTLGILAKLPGAAAMPAVLAVIAGLFRDGRPGAAWAALKYLGLGAVVIGAYYAWAVHLGRSYPPYHVAGYGYAWDVGLGALARDLFHLPELWTISLDWFYGVPFIALIAAGLWWYPGGLPGEERGRNAFLPLVWLGGGVVLYLVAAREISANPWNMHVLHVPLAMLAGRGLIVLAWTAAGHATSTAARLAAVVVLILSFSTVPLVQAMKMPFAIDSKDLGDRLEKLSAPGELVVAVSMKVGDPTAIYYSRRRGWLFPPAGGAANWSELTEDGPAAIAALTGLRDGGAKWFGLVKQAQDENGRAFMAHHPALLAWLDANAKRVEETSKILIYRLRR